MTREEKIEELLNTAKSLRPFIEDSTVEYARQFLRLIPDDVPLPKLRDIYNDLVQLQWSQLNPLELPRAKVNIYSDGETFVDVLLSSGGCFSNFFFLGEEDEEILCMMEPLFEEVKTGGTK